MSYVKNFSTQNWDQDVLASTIPVIVDFYGSWCHPCRLLNPILEDLADQYHAKITIGKINIDNNKTVGVRYNIVKVPTIIIFANGAITEIFTGYKTKTQLETILKKYL